MLALGPLQEPGGVVVSILSIGPILKPGLTEGFLARKEGRVACQM